MTNVQIKQAFLSLLLGVCVGFTFTVACHVPQSTAEQPATSPSSSPSMSDVSSVTRVDAGDGCMQLCLDMAELQCKEARPRCSHFGADGECDQEQSCVEACGAGQLRRETCEGLSE